MAAVRGQGWGGAGWPALLCTQLLCALPICPAPIHSPNLPINLSTADDIVRLGHHEHESYYGDRTKEDLTAMADSLAQSAGQPHTCVGSGACGCIHSLPSHADP